MFWKPLAKYIFSFVTPPAFIINIKLDIDSKMFLWQQAYEYRASRSLRVAVFLACLYLLPSNSNAGQEYRYLSPLSLHSLCTRQLTFFALCQILLCVYLAGYLIEYRDVLYPELKTARLVLESCVTPDICRHFLVEVGPNSVRKCLQVPL